jgi:hypothetical protein
VNLALGSRGAAVADAAIGTITTIDTLAASTLPAPATLSASGAAALSPFTAGSALRTLAAARAFPTASAVSATAASPALLALDQLAPRARHHAHLVGPRPDSEKSARAFLHHRDHHFSA